ncbi:MAG TPA: hypothetical protein DIW81_19665 [Planctomycetaceae bacterium]|nr:hypothetical protein [Rubinisphaera sp.]HCS53774.1 hypothetical protein [Planctomycetaceae bacterium]
MSNLLHRITILLQFAVYCNGFIDGLNAFVPVKHPLHIHEFGSKGPATRKTEFFNSNIEHSADACYRLLKKLPQ